MLLIGTGRRPPAPSEWVPEGPVRWDEVVAQVPGEEPEGVVRRVLLESAVPYRRRRGVRRSSQSSECAGACSQGGPQGGQGGQSRKDGPLMGCSASSQGRSGRLLLVLRGRCVSGRLGWGALGVRGMPRVSRCPPLEDMGGHLPVFHWGGGVHRVPRQVFQHRPACVVLVCT